jgi:hypothetical protein
MSTTSLPVAPPKSGGRLALWTGLLAVVAGLVLYTLQIQAANLTAPWYVPLLATFGTGLVLLSLLRRRTIWRVAALLLLGAVTAGEWWFLLSYSKLPAATGRIEQGKPIPEFTAVRADGTPDGTPFTADNLKGEKETILVFFRGRW